MKTFSAFILTMVIVAVGAYFLIGNGSANTNSVTGNAIAGQAIQGQMQRVILTQEGYNYKDAVAEADKPIAISADNTVGGCLRSAVFNVNGVKYSKYLKTPDDILELPALSKGTYTFSCSMGMGFGKLIVE